MKIKLFCPECFKSFSTNPNKGDEMAYGDVQSLLTACEITDASVMEFCCNSGHKNYIFIQNPKYELLFDIGYSAYKDGYYREACLDFAASIERFHEYCVYAMLFQNGRDSITDFETMWSMISKQSERQYGAFVILYTKVMGQPPKKYEEKYVKFRNNVTHKGMLPSKDKTICYARDVCEYISSIYHSLAEKNNMMSGVTPLLSSLYSHEKPVASMHIPTILSLICCGQSFDAAIETFEKRFDVVYEK